MSKTLRKLGLVTVAACVLSTAVFAQGLSTGAVAPNFSLKDTAGRSFKLSDYKGKVVFINFFATWCPPCRAEFPELVKMHAKYRTHSKVKIISVSMDGERSMSRVKPFADGYKAKHQVLLGKTAQTVAQNYRVEAIPQNYLVGKDGRIKAVWEGFRGPEEVSAWEEAIKKALK